MRLQYLRLKEPPHSPNLVARFLLEAYTKLGIGRRNEHVRYVKMQYTPQESNLSLKPLKDIRSRNMEITTLTYSVSGL